MSNLLVIGTSNGREHWVKDCSASIPIPHIIVSCDGYELGKIKWVLENTTAERFIFIQDSMVIRDISKLMAFFELEGSVCLSCYPGFCFARYFGLYERHTLLKVDIPEVKTKGDSIHFESRWPKAYMEACDKVSHPLRNSEYSSLLKPVLRHGRENIVIVNDIYEKYQADWGQRQYPLSGDHPVYHSKFFPESRHAHSLLRNLVGIEIGGSAHNAFGLNTLNVDRVHHDDPEFVPYRNEQINFCGTFMPVDVVATSTALPFEDQSFDFIINSHVIEHVYDPILAIKEWMRVARRYIYMIVPQPWALPSDTGRPLTGLAEHLTRYYEKMELNFDDHHNRWTSATFCDMINWILTFQQWAKGWSIHSCLDPDDKVGNGFTCVLAKNPAAP